MTLAARSAHACVGGDAHHVSPTHRRTVTWTARTPHAVVQRDAGRWPHTRVGETWGRDVGAWAELRVARGALGGRTLAGMGERPVAVITLASGYVGPPLARLLARSGHDLVLHLPGNDRSTMVAEAESATLLRDLGDLGASVETVTGVDLTKRDGNQAVIDAAINTFGRIDAACFITGSIITGRFLAAKDEHWDKLKAVNLDMVYYALQAVLPPMVEAGRGQVIVFTSATGARPEPMVSLYSSTRAGANAMVRAVGLEHAKFGVAVNAIGTNYMDFPGFLAATGADDPERRAVIEAQVPMRRLGTMDELAEFTAVLLDGRSRFQTGQFFSFSGGWST